MSIESNFYPDVLGEQRTDGQRASGLMQVLPNTGKNIAPRVGLEESDYTIDTGGVKPLETTATVKEGVIDPENGYLGIDPPSSQSLIEEIEAAVVSKNAEAHTKHKAYEQEIAGTVSQFPTTQDTQNLLDQFDRLGPQPGYALKHWVPVR